MKKEEVKVMLWYHISEEKVRKRKRENWYIYLGVDLALEMLHETEIRPKYKVYLERVY